MRWRSTSTTIASVLAAVACLLAASPALGAVHKHGGYSYVSKSLKLGKKSLHRYQLACPKGTHVYGGGISAKAAFGKLRQRQSYPIDTKDADKAPDDAWGVLVKNGGKRLKARMYATCGPIKPTFDVVHVSLFPNSYSQEVDTHCQSPSTVLGGGVRGSKGIEFEDGGPYDSSLWYAYSHNASSHDAGFTQYAICGKANVVYPENGGPLSPMSSVAFRAPCPAGFSIISGGSSSPGSVVTTTSVPFGTYKGWLLRGDFVGDFPGSAYALAACAADRN